MESLFCDQACRTLCLKSTINAFHLDNTETEIKEIYQILEKDGMIFQHQILYTKLFTLWLHAS